MPAEDPVEESTSPPASAAKQQSAAPAEELAAAAAAAAVDLAVTVYGPEAASAGSPIAWQITVRNNGPDTANSFTMTDQVPAGVTGVGSGSPGCSVGGSTVTCSGGPLAAGAQQVLTITGTTPNPFTFPLVNTASVTAGVDDTDSNSGNNSDLTVTTTASPEPSLGVVTQATLQDANGNQVGDVGETITYTVQVSNLGNVSLFNLVVEHNGATIPCADTTLSLNESTTCAAPSHVITAGDLTAGQVVTVTTGTATAPSGSTVQAPESRTNIPAFLPNPALTLVKEADLNDGNGNALADLGESIDFSFTATNVGNVPLTGLVIVDPSNPGVTCPQTSLAPNAVVVCTSDAPHVTTAADIAAAQVVNTAHAEATAPGGADVSSPDSVTNTPTITASPGVALDKTAVLDDDNNNGVADLGELIRWSFLVINNGNVRLVGVQVDDPVAGQVTCLSTTLEIQDATFCQGVVAHVVTEADIIAGEVTNTAVARGTTDPGGDPVVSPPDSTVTPTAAVQPGLTLEKAASLNDLNDNDLADAGETIDYTFELTNTGNVTLTDVQVDDPKAGDVTCPTTTLAPGGTVTCTAEPYTVTEADIDAGVVHNVAVGRGTPPVGPPVVTPPDTADVPVANPGLSMTKAAALNDLDGDDLADVDETIDYTFVLTNTGNVPLTDVQVDDPKAGDVTCPTTTLAPGGTVTCTAEPYTVTEADIDAGVVHNVAVGSGQPPGTDPPVVTPPVTADVPVDDGSGSGGGGATTLPSIDLVKHAALSDEDGDGRADTGEQVTYTFLVTNTGDEQLRDIVVDDPKIDEVTCPSSTLDAGESMTCTAPTYTVTIEDVDSGSVDNVATASGVPAEGEPVESPPSSVSLPVDQDAVGGGGGASLAGDNADTGLAYTGVHRLGMAFGWALLFLTSGAMLMIADRRRRNSQLK